MARGVEEMVWPCSVRASESELQTAHDAAACHKEAGSTSGGGEGGTGTEQQLPLLSFLTAKELLTSHELRHNLLLLPHIRRKMQLLKSKTKSPPFLPVALTPYRKLQKTVSMPESLNKLINSLISS